MSSFKLPWGFGGPPYWEFQNLDPDKTYSDLRFVMKHGLSVASCGIGAFDAMTPEYRDKLHAFMTEHQLRYAPYVGFDYLNATADEAKKKTDEIVGALHRHQRFFAGSICKTGPHAGHRFDRTATVEAKMEKISKSLRVLAAECKKMDVPLGIENHGDYYVSDLVMLIQQTPGLGLFLDTGNCFLIAEACLPAFEIGAPYVVGTHFKDHFVKPNPQTLMFEIGGAPLGEGDVPLREFFKLLMTKNPSPRRIVQEIEMIAPKGMNPNECMERSIKFCHKLEEEFVH